MAVLTMKQRSKIPPGKFGIFDKREGKGKYPITDPAHAANAKARATQQVNAGNLSASDAAQIRKKANAVLNQK